TQSISLHAQRGTSIMHVAKLCKALNAANLDDEITPQLRGTHMKVLRSVNKAANQDVYPRR
ncbi:hypothetical protein TELCIR_16433, partial [Teladorsagia circumcincta]